MSVFDSVKKIVEKGRTGMLIRSFFYALISSLAAAKVKQEVNKYKSIDCYVNAAFSNFPFKQLIKPSQVKEEITELLEVLEKRDIKFVLEIGTASGGTLFLLTRVSTFDAVIVSIDFPSGRFGGGYPIQKIPIYRSFATNKQKMHLIRGNSHELPTLENVEKILDGNKFDFIFIDGDHTYDGVKKDFTMYCGLVRSGGVIAFHDIVAGHPEHVGGVPKFWNEIKHKFKYLEIVKNRKQGWAGIGVIYV